MTRLAAALYLATLALLPWGGLVPFPWLHENAQWSDVLFAASALAWAAGLLAARRWPGLRPVHAARSPLDVALRRRVRQHEPTCGIGPVGADNAVRIDDILFRF